MREYIDAAAFKEMMLCADAALSDNIQIINDLNVFPVPDGDTGTNMSLTMNSAAAELRKKSFDAIDAAASCVASALLRGARGGIRRRAVRRCRRGIQGRYEARGGHHTHRLPPCRCRSRRGRERGRKP